MLLHVITTRSLTGEIVHYKSCCYQSSVMAEKLDFTHPVQSYKLHTRDILHV